MHYQIEWYVMDIVVPYTEKGHPIKSAALTKCGGCLWVEAVSEAEAIHRMMVVTNRTTTRCNVLSSENRTIKTIQHGNKNKVRSPSHRQGLEKDSLVLSGPTNT